MEGEHARSTRIVQMAPGAEHALSQRAGSGGVGVVMAVSAAHRVVLAAN